MKACSLCSCITVLMGLIAGSFLWAAGDDSQENEKQILGAWQVGKAVVEFLPEGKARIVERGETKEGSYEINGDWLFVRVSGEDERSGLMLIEGDRMTVDEQEFRRLVSVDAGQLIGKWTSDEADLEFRADGSMRLVEKSPDEGKSGRIEIEGATVLLIEDNGDTDVKPFVIDGDTLTIDGVERLERVGGERDPNMPLAGEWRHAEGTIVKVTSEGRFTMVAEKIREGTYVLEGPALTVKTRDGEESGFGVAFEDGALVLDGQVRFARVGADAEPSVASSGKKQVASVEIAATGTSHRYEGALDAFLEARKNLVMIAAEGLGAKHPSAVRAIIEARFLLRRCQEEADLLGLTTEADALVRHRLDYYGNAFEEEVAEWGSR